MKEFEKVDLFEKEHSTAVVSLLNEYMKDEMGNGQEMPGNIKKEVLEGLKNHKAYLGFLIKYNNQYIALANCNLSYSTWKAKHLINIHDFIVHPDYRKMGVGSFLLKGIKKYAKERDYCKLNLEVREDNIKARGLYKKEGFKPGNPNMLFWEMEV